MQMITFDPELFFSIRIPVPPAAVGLIISGIVAGISEFYTGAGLVIPRVITVIVAGGKVEGKSCFGSEYAGSKSKFH